MTTEQDAVDAVVTFTIHRPERLAYRIADMGGDEDAPEYHAWYADERVAIRDGRCVADHFSLDREGFVLLQSPTGVTDFYDSESFRTTYDPEIEALVRRQTGAAEVVVFDHTIRVQSDEKRREMKVRETVKLAHNDYTEKSGPQRVRDPIWKRKSLRFNISSSFPRRYWSTTTSGARSPDRCFRCRLPCARPAVSRRRTGWSPTSSMPTGSARSTTSPRAGDSAGGTSRA